jgi:hypothetical protein
MPLLHWLNRDTALRQAKDVPYRLLQPEPALSYGDPTSPNMLIQAFGNKEAYQVAVRELEMELYKDAG